MTMMVANGPIAASVYCASPPVRFGMRAFSSESPSAVKIFIMHAIIIEIINVDPIAPAPCPRDIKQLVATISPTPVAIALGSPIKKIKTLNLQK